MKTTTAAAPHALYRFFEWAPKMSERAARKEGYMPHRGPGEAPPIYDCDHLARTQTEWTKGKDRAREDAIRDAELRRNSVR